METSLSGAGERSIPPYFHACSCVDLFRGGLDFLRVVAENEKQTSFGRLRGPGSRDLRQTLHEDSIAQCVSDDVCGLQPDREMFFFTGKGCRVKRRIGWNQRGRGEIKIALAVRGVCCEVFDNAGGGVNRFPVDAIFSGDADAAFEDFGIGDNLGEQVRIARVVGIFGHGWTDGGVEAFFDGERIVGAEEGQGIGGGEALRVFGEWLRGDADGLDFVAGFLVCGFRGAKELQGFLDLGFVFGAI